MAVDTSDLREGLAATAPYLLSHHLPSEYYRCYSLHLFGRNVHLCARCSGIYPGILAGLLAITVAPSAMQSVLLVALLPAPALLDWIVTTFTPRRGSNSVRTATGASLGYAYGLGLYHLFANHDPRIVGIGLLYAVTASVLLMRSK